MFKRIIIISVISFITSCSLLTEYGSSYGHSKGDENDQRYFSPFETSTFGRRGQKADEIFPGPPGNPAPISDYSLLLLGLSALFFMLFKLISFYYLSVYINL